MTHHSSPDGDSPLLWLPLVPNEHDKEFVRWHDRLMVSLDLSKQFKATHQASHTFDVSMVATKEELEAARELDLLSSAEELVLRKAQLQEPLNSIRAMHQATAKKGF